MTNRVRHLEAVEEYSQRDARRVNNNAIRTYHPLLSPASD